jgi:hypothetical protein
MGERACQLNASFASVPCTSTTGSGCVLEGRHDQSFEPGGIAVGLKISVAMPSAKVPTLRLVAASAGSCVTAPSMTTARSATSARKVWLRMAGSPRNGPP